VVAGDPGEMAVLDVSHAFAGKGRFRVIDDDDGLVSYLPLLLRLA
jgi:hypothetical protein